MTDDDVERYYLQFPNISLATRKEKMRELRRRIRIPKEDVEVSEWVLAIENKDGKIIGKMEVFDIGSKSAFLSIDIPYENWIGTYGVEAIDQFVKICTEQKCFRTIELEAKNSIVENYKKQHNLSNYIMKFA